DLSPEAGYQKMQGTSMASPVVAGAVALLFQQNPALTASQVITLLQNNALRDGVTGPNANTEYGAGKLNVYQAMARLVNPNSTSTMAVAQYDASLASSGVTLVQNQSIALRFHSPIAGSTSRIRGVLFHTSAAQPIGGYDVQLWSDNGGVPDRPIGAPVNLAGTGVKPSSWNYVDLSSLRLDLSESTEYHVSITPVGSDGSFRHDGATTTNRTTFSNGSGFSPRTYDAMIRVVVTSGATALPVDEVIGVEEALALSAGRPNPFEASTRFTVSAGKGGPVRVELFDMLGRRVAVAFDGEMVPGATETITLDGHDLAPGVYVVRALTADAVVTRTVTRH
ncbi:MAG TPA: S8 family serine peptidase, partial [Rhodothermales bacterium]|nr:S8 family serine peptidase [Rhodothermales bacterium]